mmetsp:Transcript_23765/g.35337  ORF Transcript_23765/g.35337 Transcript_23765/m.35337 type:complete len:151 (+) Transcript_23765:3-455(+)
MEEVSFNGDDVNVDFGTHEEDYYPTVEGSDIEPSLSLLTKIKKGKLGRFVKRFKIVSTSKDGLKEKKSRGLFSRGKKKKERCKVAATLQTHVQKQAQTQAQKQAQTHKVKEVSELVEEVEEFEEFYDPISFYQQLNDEDDDAPDVPFDEI